MDRLCLAIVWEHGPVSWDEAFADRYEEWSGLYDGRIAFYAVVAGQAEGPLA